MSTDASAASAARPAVLDPAGRATLRYGLGTALSVAVAYGVGWPLAYIAPVLVVSMFLGPPGNRLPFVAGITMVLSVAAACVAAYAVTAALAPYPLVLLPVVMLTLFFIYYGLAGGVVPFLLTWLLIATLLIPMMAQTSMGLAWEIVKSLIIAAALGLLVNWVTHWLLPDPPPREARPAPAPTRASPTPDQRFQVARRSLLVVMPIVLVAMTFNLSGLLLTMIFAALMSMQPSLTAGRKGGAGMLTGNLVGGLVAVLVYNVIQGAPTYSMVIALLTLVGLILGRRLFSGSPSAALYGTAMTTALILVGGSTLPYADEADVKFITRLAQVGLAALYIVSAFWLWERITAVRPESR
jgi:hypothetical protein